MSTKSKILALAVTAAFFTGPASAQESTKDDLLQKLKAACGKGHAFEEARALADMGDPRAIPPMIGIIDSDNSYDTVYGVGYYGLGFSKLGKQTGVPYRFWHDGPWWRRWWEANKDRFPEDARNKPIPGLPKTEHGENYVPFPENLDTMKGKLAFVRNLFAEGQAESMVLCDIGRDCSERGDPRAIPFLIGMIDADNSQATVYGLGYYGLCFSELGRLTGVRYSEFHDGPWWRRWWQANNGRFPEEARNTPIPDLPKTDHGKKYTPFPADMNTFEGLAANLPKMLSKHKPDGPQLAGFAEALADTGDPRAIPLLIGLIAADDSHMSIYGVGHFGLRKLTGVQYEESHNAEWWRQWWEQNKTRYPAEAQAFQIPHFSQEAAAGRAAAEKTRLAEIEAELAEVPSTRITLARDKNRCYFLIGPKGRSNPPPKGYKLCVVLPGGDGSEAFNPFVRRILKYALDADWLLAQPLAFKWTPSQEIVWPTENCPVDAQQFSTETFVEAVIDDAKARYPIDAASIVTLSWSSGGPAAYAVSLQPATAVTGSYIAMSVFKPALLPPLSNAKGQRYYIEHSPEDQICPYAQAQTARDQLKKAGATVQSSDYKGRHGWHGNVYARIKKGLTWLTTN